MIACQVMYKGIIRGWHLIVKGTSRVHLKGHGGRIGCVRILMTLGWVTNDVGQRLGTPYVPQPRYKLVLKVKLDNCFSIWIFSVVAILWMGVLI